MSADELNTYFCTTDVLEITEVIRAADDADLRRLIDLEHFRAAGVVAILDRFAEFADAERLGEIQGSSASSSPGRRRTARATPSGSGTASWPSTARPSPTSSSPRTSSTSSGWSPVESNAALLYLGGRLGVEGHEMLALAVGSVFTVPGSDQLAVDPTALDPVDVATAVATTSGKHMRSVMEGGFRPIVLEEVFRRFPSSSTSTRRGHDPLDRLPDRWPP